MALYYRDAAGGCGQEIDVSLYEPTFRMMEFLVGQYDKLGKVKERSAMIADSSSPAGTYETSDRKWVVLVCSTEPTFRRLAKAIDRADLVGSPQFDSNEHRVQNNTELDTIIRGWMQAHTEAQVVEILDAAGVPVSPIYSIADIFTDPHYQARQDIVEAKHPRFGTIKMPGVVPRLSVTPGSVKFSGPELGAHNKEIFCGLLGLSEEEVVALQARSII
jgi:formyl-CoA transferase